MLYTCPVAYHLYVQLLTQPQVILHMKLELHQKEKWKDFFFLNPFKVDQGDMSAGGDTKENICTEG